MTTDVGRLLDDAAEHCERTAPQIDPVRSLRRRQARVRDRRRHVVALAFVAFVLLLQVLPRPALGAPVPVAAGPAPAVVQAGAVAEADARG